jgi:hypothetical protein
MKNRMYRTIHYERSSYSGLNDNDYNDNKIVDNAENLNYFITDLDLSNSGYHHFPKI